MTDPTAVQLTEGEREAGAVAAMLATHRLNYHQRAVTPNGEPLTTANMRYTSCDGCDWLGGWHDETGWEAHVAQAIVTARVSQARAEGGALRAALLLDLLAWVADQGADGFTRSLVIEEIADRAAALSTQPAPDVSAADGMIER